MTNPTPPTLHEETHRIERSGPHETYFHGCSCGNDWPCPEQPTPPTEAGTCPECAAGKRTSVHGEMCPHHPLTPAESERHAPPTEASLSADFDAETLASLRAAHATCKQWCEVCHWLATIATLTARVSALTDALLLDGHQCEPIASMVMAEGRDWWLGKLTAPLADWPEETHCLHMKTPLKAVVFGTNRGDWDQLAVLAYIAGGKKHLSQTWIERMASGMEKRAAALRGDTGQTASDV